MTLSQVEAEIWILLTRVMVSWAWACGKTSAPSSASTGGIAASRIRVRAGVRGVRSSREGPPRRGGRHSGGDGGPACSRARGAVMTSALGARRSALGARRSALGARRSALGARRSALGARRSALGARRSALGARRSALGARRSALGALNQPDSLQPLCAKEPHRRTSSSHRRGPTTHSHPPGSGPARGSPDSLSTSCCTAAAPVK